MQGDLKFLMQKLNYVFKNIEFLETALKHRSSGKTNNERLEFIGDSIVNFIIANELFVRFPEAKEGQLSRLRANLVKGDTLAEIAKEFELNLYIRLGQGETKSGGAHRVSILADTVEAIIGAIFLDVGIEKCYDVVAAWYKERVGELSLDDVHKDPKSLLQELVQAKQLPLPEYNLIEITGAEHNQCFIIECKIGMLDHAVKGEGTSRRRAEQAAAQATIEELNYGK